MKLEMNDEQRVMAALDVAGTRGLTSDELQVALDLCHETASARCTELSQEGRIAASHQRRYTRAGRLATVYIDARYKDSDQVPGVLPPPMF